MIVAAALFPAAPLLLPGLTGAEVAEVELLRHRSRAAIGASLQGDVDRVVVVGSAPATGPVDVGLPSPEVGFRGGHTPDGPTLPVGHAVALSLLNDVSTPTELLGVDPSTPTSECLELGRALAAAPDRTALLVAADGSARRSATAPGYLDPDALAVDDEVVAALRSGNASGLAALDPGRCARQLVDGRAAWQVLAGAVGARPVTAVDVDAADPYGVLYVAGCWRLS